MRESAFLVILLVICLPSLCDAAPPIEDYKSQSKIWLTELQSGDATRIALAVQEIRDSSFKAGGVGFRYAPRVLIDARLYAEAETICMDGIRTHPLDSNAIAQWEELRTQSFLAQGKPKEALAAAKLYFNICPMSSNDKAIALLIRCLAAANPDDRSSVSDFVEQQVAGTATEPATQPIGNSDLTASVLSSITIDPKPYEAILNGMRGSSFSALTQKGNLLLLCDRTKEAHEVFKQAYSVANSTQWAKAKENIARSIRAESGSLGAANAYMASLPTAMTAATGADAPAAQSSWTLQSWETVIPLTSSEPALSAWLIDLSQKSTGAQTIPPDQCEALASILSATISPLSRCSSSRLLSTFLPTMDRRQR